MSRCCSLLTRNGPAGGLGVLVWLVTAVTMGFVLSKKAQEGIGAAAGDETAPSKAWGTNRSRDVPISSQQSLREPQPAFSTSPPWGEARLGRKSPSL